MTGPAENPITANTASSAAAEGAHHTLSRGDATIAYHHTPASGSRRGKPGVIFLGGLRSDMTGTKATALESWAVAQGLAFTRFDYQGHGISSGRYEDGCVSVWAADAIAVLDQVTSGPQVLVGSSMGGWAMLLTVRERLDRVVGMVGVAAAPDFTENLMWPSFDEATRQKLLSDGVIYQPSDYGDPEPVTLRLIEDGREHRVLTGPYQFNGPVRLLHGIEDTVVPWQTTTAIAETVTSADLRIILVKGGDHRLSTPPDIELLCRTVEEVVEATANRPG